VKKENSLQQKDYLKEEKKSAANGCGMKMWITYKNFKKWHRMITW
jgi:hypothetical protein